MSSERLHFRLEVDRENDAIAGRLRPDRGEAVFFAGWLELINALEQARSRDRDLTSADDHTAGRACSAGQVDDTDR